MAFIFWICITLSILQASNSYVLLTANVEDIHAIANQVAHSPVLGQIKDIWRRASETFQTHYDRPVEKTMHMRADAEYQQGRDDSSHEASSELRAERRQAMAELASIGREAAGYVHKIQDVVDSL